MVDRRVVRSVLLARVVAVGGILGARVVGQAAPPPPLPPRPPAAWTWISPVGGAWRLPDSVRRVAIVDARHVVAITANDVIAVDRATGMASAPVRVLADDGDDMSAVVRVGSRVLAVGTHGGEPAAWQLTLAPPTATRLALPDPAAARGGRDLVTRIVPSPDARRVLMCTWGRWPVIRDAATLAVERIASDADCDHAWWEDATHLALGTDGSVRVLDVITGARSAPRSVWTLSVRGPRGRAWAHTEAGVVLRVDGQPVIDDDVPRPFHEPPAWTPDGAYAVIEGGSRLWIYPATAGARPRSIDLPVGAHVVDVDARTAVVRLDTGLLTVELATGVVTRPEGHLSSIRQIAPRGGAVLSLDQHLRLWRDGSVAELGIEADLIAAEAVDAPVAVLTPERLGWWTPASGAWQDVSGEPSLVTDRLARVGTRLAFNRRDGIWRTSVGGRATPWVALARGARLLSLDLAHELLIVRRADVTHAIDVGRRTAWPLLLPRRDGTCAIVHEARMSPDGTRLVAQASGALWLIDARTHAPLHGLELDEVPAWTFLPTGELLVAIAGEIVIADPRHGTAVSWTPPSTVAPDAVGVDSAGRELAVGFHDGRVLWADLAEVRAHAQERALPLRAPAPCAGPREAVPYAALIAP